MPLIPLIIGNLIVSSEISNIFEYYVLIPEYFYTTLLDMFDRSVYTFLLIVLIGPLVEEILFRGVILEGFLSRYNTEKAILFSAAIFSIFHLNPVQFISAFVCGIILGYLYVNTRSLIPCFIAHAFHNGIIFCLYFLPVNVPGLDGNPVGPQFQPMWLDIIGTVLMVIGIWGLMNMKLLQEKPTINTIQGQIELS
ncbi:MAG: CPBP family intramembrane metalloprotease [Candidatus Scalindua sp.]|nr:CPBP family intramembrane metalloprotease [Candidatus Scalindua sp.]